MKKIVFVLAAILIFSSCSSNKSVSYQPVNDAERLLSRDKWEDLEKAISGEYIDMPEMTCTVFSDEKKVTITVIFDPIGIGYMVVPLSENAIPIIQEQLKDKDIPFEYSVLGLFYKNGVEDTSLSIKTSDLEVWTIIDGRSLFVKTDATFDVIKEYLNK